MRFTAREPRQARLANVLEGLRGRSCSGQGRGWRRGWKGGWQSYECLQTKETAASLSRFCASHTVQKAKHPLCMQMSMRVRPCQIEPVMASSHCAQSTRGAQETFGGAVHNEQGEWIGTRNCRRACQHSNK